MLGVITVADWDSIQYLKFKTQRTQPSIDLVKRIDLSNPKKVIDIGCGPGNSTNVLYERFQNADILGVDYSKNMLEKAKANYPKLHFAEFDARNDFWDLDNDYDIVFSNACIQWIPNHKELLPKMMSLLRTGGVLAVQIPVQFNEPIHKIINEVSSRNCWKEKFNFKRIFNILDDCEYYDILSEVSSDFEMWQTTYYHKMNSHQEIIEWYKSTGLKPYLDSLDGQDKEEFLNDVYNEIVKHYKIQKNGEIIFKFPRLFFVAEK